MEESKKYLNNLVTSWARTCESEVRNWPKFQEFNLDTIKLDWSTRRTSHLGGWYDGPGISIAMCLLARPKTNPYRYYEYKSFDADKYIGGFFAKDPELGIKTIITHEVSHAAQYFADKVLGIHIDRGHGLSFKKPYKKLRDTLINPHIPINQKQLSMEYADLISSILKGK